jgi:predicted dehydrogenase
VLNVGVIGYGYWGPNLVRNFNQNPATRIAMVADRDEQRLAAAKKTYPAIETTTDPYALMRSPKVDAVAIAVPVRYHYEMARAALELGKHVWLEKPMALTSKECEDLVNAGERTGLTLLVDHTFLYTGAVHKMKQVIDAGELGDLWYVDSVRINLGLFQHDVNVVWDLAPHDFSILQFLLNRMPLSLSSVGANHTGNGIEDVAYVNLDYGDNLMANVHVNWLSPVKIRHTIVGGSRKMLVYNDLEPVEKIRIYDTGINVAQNDVLGRHRALIQYRTGDMLAPMIPNTEALSTEVTHFAECVREKKRPVSDGMAGWNVVRLLEACGQSLRSGGHRVTLG